MEIISYLSNGYPTLEHSRKIAHEYADAGCKIIEVDFPAKNPYLESEFLGNRMKCALESCSDYSKYMVEISNLKKELKDIKFLLLAYEDTVKEIGVDNFINFAKDNNIYDILLVGLSNNEIKDRLMENGLKVSCYIQRHLPKDEIELAKKSNGFIYLQAKGYETQEKNEKYPTLKDCVNFLKSEGIDRPIYCGVGIRDEEDVKTVKESGADAAFVGSTILKLHDNVPKMKNKIKSLIKACK